MHFDLFVRYHLCVCNFDVCVFGSMYAMCNFDVYSYFEKGCRKNCALDNPER